ncbi:MAG: tetraacyldisaccharide 4'-kinase, partial [Gluconacetobacter diazotrophicus]|nr:tetraacyldisaccharide 4'-kinase [Gluconacetobacter diazotrophicus]
DHHRFRPAELAALQREADRRGAVLVTTPKDAVRLPDEVRRRVRIARPFLRWRDPAAPERLLDRVLARSGAVVGR